jgi:hypothetical protein
VSDIIGKVLSVDTRPLGENLVNDAGVGATMLYVVDASPFVGTSSGVVAIDGSAYLVASVDVDRDIIFLATPLTTAAPADSLVEVFPATPEKYATVDLGNEEGEAVLALVPHALVELLPDGVRDAMDQETVVLDPTGVELTVSDVLGKSLATSVIDLDRFTPEVIALITMRFDTVADRDSALAEMLTEGMEAYVKETNLSYQYSLGEWVPLLTFIRKGVDQANSSTTFAADDAFRVTLVPGWYRIEAFLHLRGNPDGDVAVKWSFSGELLTADSRICQGPSSSTSTGASTLMRSTGNSYSSSIRYGVADVTSDLAVTEDLLFNVASTGLLQLLFAQAQSASGAATVGEQSRLYISKVR